MNTWVTLNASKNVIFNFLEKWRQRKNNSTSQFSIFGKMHFQEGAEIFSVFFTFPTCSLFLVYAFQMVETVDLKACVPKSCADFNLEVPTIY